MDEQTQIKTIHELIGNTRREINNLLTDLRNDLRNIFKLNPPPGVRIVYKHTCNDNCRWEDNRLICNICGTEVEPVTIKINGKNIDSMIFTNLID